MDDASGQVDRDGERGGGGADGPGAGPRRTPRWADVHIWQVQIVRDVLAIVAIFAIVWLGYLVRLVTVPLLLALLVAYLTEPVTRRLARVDRIGRRRAVILIMVVVLFGVGIPVAAGLVTGVSQAVGLGRSWSARAAEVRASVEEPGSVSLRQAVPEGGWRWIRDRIQEQVHPDVEIPRPATPGAVEELEDAGVLPESPVGDAVVVEMPGDDAAVPETEPLASVAASGGGIEGGGEADAVEPDEEPGAEIAKAIIDLGRANAEAVGLAILRALGTAFGVVGGVVGGVLTLALTVFLTLTFFYFIATGYPRVVGFGASMLPSKDRARLIDLLGKMDRVVSGFVRGRLLIGLIMAVIFTIGWSAVGVPAALIVGTLTGFLAVAPYAGLLGVPVAMVLLWLEGHTGVRGHWLWVLAMPMVVYQIGQIADDYFLTPAIQGKETGLDIPTVLFATIAGGVLMGVYGLLIAIPIAACLKILMVEVVWPRVQKWVRGEADDFLPIR